MSFITQLNAFLITYARIFPIKIHSSGLFLVARVSENNLFFLFLEEGDAFC